jgi:hypothetical protein
MSVDDMLRGTRLGVTYPQVVLPTPSAFEARMHALRRLREYLCLIDFYRAGASSPYRLPPQDVHLEQPDAIDALRFPCVSVIAGRAEQISLLGGSIIDEATFGKYGQGTVVVQDYEHYEIFTLEVMASQRAERTGLATGIDAALQPIAGVSSLRLSLPAYYDSTAVFSSMSGQSIDDPDVVKGRRRAHRHVLLRVPVLRLVGAMRLRPTPLVEVEE